MINKLRLKTALTLLFCGVAIQLFSQTKKYPIVFYNLENLFDTIKSPNVIDDDFTPKGSYAWNTPKYQKKIANIDEVFYKLASTARTFPIIIGVSEIENRNVLEDIVSAPKIGKANYQIVHYDSPDARGIDVALLYRPDVFKYEGSKPLRVFISDSSNFKTRDVLMTWGTIENEKFYFFVCHWPSRRGGRSDLFRCAAAQTAKDAIDSVTKLDPSSNIILMGDLNDDPVDKSIYEVLGAKGKIDKNARAGELFNPFYDMFKAGYGSLGYQDSWNIFDNIVVNSNLVNQSKGKLTLYKPDYNKYWGNIFNQPFLTNQSGQYKNYPFRTYVGTNFQGGYSDHFPVFIYIVKNE